MTASSPDGEVRVTVDSHGVPADVYFAESARGEGPARFAAELNGDLLKPAGRMRCVVWPGWRLVGCARYGFSGPSTSTRIAGRNTMT